MNTDKLQDEKCDGVHHLSDHELEVLAGGNQASLLGATGNQKQEVREGFDLIKDIFG